MNRTGIEWTDWTWNPVKGFDGYFVSKWGEILSLQRDIPKIMKPLKTKSGHLYVLLYSKNIDSRHSKQYIHRLVLQAWGRDAEPNEECRHLDGNPENNNIENLCWGSHQQNVDDKWHHGTMPIGERNASAKLTTSDVIEIRTLRANKAGSLRALGKKYGVSHTEIRRAAIGMKWRSIQ